MQGTLAVGIVKAASDAPRRDEAFRAAVTPLLGVAVRVLRRLGVRERLELDDALQTVLVGVDRRFDELQNPKELRAYLCATCVGVARDLGRSRKRRAALASPDEDINAVVCSAATPEELLGRREEFAILERLLALMNEERREVFILYEIEELTGHEIAKHLGVPLGTVFSRLRKGREEFLAIVARTQSKDHRALEGRR